MSRRDLNLITLGRLELAAPPGRDDVGLGKQRRKLAVLAVLALARRPVARDTLVEMFWGDQDEARARHSLSDALSHLRRALGPDAIALRQAEVALSDTVGIGVDAAEFAALVAAGEHERALALYGGPFLDAVYVGGSRRFEEWVERERRRLEELFLRACDEQCDALARDGRWEECAAVARRWLDADPLSVDAAAALLDALAAPGTRDADARALREYEHLRARLEREFEVAPDPAVVAAAQRIRVRLAAAAPGEDASPAAIPAAPEPASAEDAPRRTMEGIESAGSAHRTVEPTAQPCPPPLTSPAPDRRGRLRRGARMAWAAVVLLVLVLAGGLFARSRHPPAGPVSPARVAVLPFAVHGGPEHGYLRAGMVDLLSTSLHGAGSLRTVDPRAVLGSASGGDDALTPAQGQAVAARFGAGLFVLGDVVAAGERVRISAALYGGRRGRSTLARAAVEGRPDELFRLVDRLTAQLLAVHPGGEAGTLIPIAAATTSSLPALKAYLEGEAHYRAGRFVPAFDAFQRAAARDTTFALAHYRASQTALWGALLPWDSVLEWSGRAVRHGERLNRPSRQLVEAFHASRRGGYDDAERLFRDVLSTRPDDVEAWYQLAEVLFHSNPLRGRSFVESRGPLERVLALEPGHLPSLLHLVRVAAHQGRRAELDSLVRRATAHMPDADEGWVPPFPPFPAGGPTPLGAALGRLRTEPDEGVRISAERVAVFGGNLAGAERILAILVQPPRLAEARALGYVQLAELETARGRSRRAEAHLAAAAPLAPALALEHRALVAALPFLPRADAGVRALRDTILAWDAAPPPSKWPVGAVYDGLHPHIRAYLAGLLSLRAGDPDAAERSARELDALASRGTAEPRELARGLAESVRAHLAASRGRHAEALAGFERGRLQVSEGLLESPLGTQALERFARAESLRALGRDAEALPWYASIAETNFHALVYLPAAHLRQAEIHAKLGDRARAARHYAAFLSLWRNPDPELRPVVDRARARLAALRREGK